MKIKRVKRFLTLFFIITLISASVLSCKKGGKKKAKKDKEKRTDLRLKEIDKELSFEVTFKDELKNIEIIELGSDNIEVWAKNGMRDRTLVLFDLNLNIQYEIPDEKLLEAKRLIDSEDYESLSRYTGITKSLKQLYSPYDYIYAAHRLGIINDVIWILPIRHNITFDYRDFFKQKLRDDRSLNYRDEDIDSFEFDKNKLVGEVFDIPVTVTTLEDFKLLDEDVLVSLNMTYISSFVYDNVKTPVEDVTIAFLNSFSKKPVVSNYFTIVNSNATFDVDIMFRFIPKIIKNILMDPNLMHNPKIEWNIKLNADKKLSFVDYDGAEAEYLMILETMPDDAGTYFQLAFLYLKKKELEKTSYYIEEAALRDEHYVLGYVALTNHIENVDKKLKLLSLGQKRHPENIPILTVLANIYYEKGMFKDSLDTYLKLINIGVESYDLNFYIADCYFQLKEYNRAKDMYNKTFALLNENFKKSYAFFYINLAEVYEQLNDKENAIKNYELFLNYTKHSPDSDGIKLRIKRLKGK